MSGATGAWSGRAMSSGRLSTSWCPMAPVPGVRTTSTQATGGSAPAFVALPVRALSAGQVADWFELVARADRALAEEMDWVGGCRAPACWETVVRLESLLHRLRDGARVRAELALLDPDLLRAGGAVWVRRAGLGRPFTSDPAPAAAGDLLAASARCGVRGVAEQGAAGRGGAA